MTGLFGSVRRKLDARLDNLDLAEQLRLWSLGVVVVRASVELVCCVVAGWLFVTRVCVRFLFLRSWASVLALFNHLFAGEASSVLGSALG